MGSLSPNGLSTTHPGSGTAFCIRSNDIYQPIGIHSFVTLTAAQIISMFTTPIALLPTLPTLPAGQTYAIDCVTFIMNAGATAFTGGGAVSVQYSGGAAVVNTLAAAVVTSASSSATVRQGIDATATAGAAITITNATAAFATGNGTLLIDISYRVVGAY
jgi:hypothetical protein